MFSFLEKIKNLEIFKTPLEKIEFMISQRNENLLKNLPFDVFEKILGDVLFDFIKEKNGGNVVEGEGLFPEQRLDLFLEKTKSLTIERDFLRLIGGKRFFELSLLLDRDSTETIKFYRPCHGYVYYMSGLLTEIATIYGNLDALKLLHEKNRKFCMENSVLDIAVKHGFLEIVKFLYENRPELECSSCAMDVAAENGHIDVIEWLDKNKPEVGGCSRTGLDLALENGHYDVISYLRNYFELKK